MSYPKVVFKTILLLISSLIFNTLTVDANTPCFQQYVDYKIVVQLDTERKVLNGNLDLTYFNKSKDTLTFIYFHLWANAHIDNKTPLAKQLVRQRDTKLHFAADSALGSITNFAPTIGGRSLTLEAIDAEIIKVILEKPLLPNQSLKISSAFTLKLPIAFSRLGYDESVFSLTQWYPKPAVYDCDGWHTQNNLNFGEYYAEWGNYSVYITLPDNFIVAATGELKTEGEQYRYQNFAKETQNWLETSTNFDTTNLPVFPAGNGSKTVHFQQDSVHDFAWFASKDFLIDAGSVKNPNSKNEVKTFAFFDPKYAKLMKNAVNYIDSSLFYYSQWVGAYPYKTCSVVLGPLSAGGGMEYPTITIISPMPNEKMTELVIAHEVGHNWFQGMLANHEQRDPWLDEGVNSFYEDRYMKQQYPQEKELLDMGLFELLSDKSETYLNKWLLGIGKSQPANLHANEYSMTNGGLIIYKKVAGMLEVLEQYLGRETFDLAMQTYFNRFRLKHVKASDLQQVFEEVSKQKLDWFFVDWMSSTTFLPYSIKSAQTKNGVTTLKIKNHSKVALPIILGQKIAETDSILDPLIVPGFSKGVKQVELTQRTPGVNELELYPGSDFLGDANKRQSINLDKRIFKTPFPKPTFLFYPENPKEPRFYYTPTFGGTAQDKFMIGLAVYNSLITPKKWAFHVNAMRSFEQEKFVGSAGLARHFVFEKGKIRNFNVGINAKTFGFNSFSDYRRGTFDSEIKFKVPLNDAIESKLTFQIGTIQYNSDAKLTERTGWGNDLVFSELAYMYIKASAIDPNKFKVALNTVEKMVRLSGEFTQRIHYGKKNRYFEGRVFGGLRISVSELQWGFANGPMELQLTNFYAATDYLADDIFLDRVNNTGFLARQTVRRDGGFRIAMPANAQPYGRGSNALAAINLNSTLPFTSLVQVFLDAGTFEGAGNDPVYTDKLAFVGGLSLRLIPDIFEIHFPLVISNSLKLDLNATQDNAWKRINFTLKINAFQPFKLTRNLSLSNWP